MSLYYRINNWKYNKSETIFDENIIKMIKNDSHGDYFFGPFTSKISWNRELANICYQLNIIREILKNEMIREERTFENSKKLRCFYIYGDFTEKQSTCNCLL